MAEQADTIESAAVWGPVTLSSFASASNVGIEAGTVPTSNT